MREQFAGVARAVDMVLPRLRAKGVIVLAAATFGTGCAPRRRWVIRQELLTEALALLDAAFAQHASRPSAPAAGAGGVLPEGFPST